MTIAEMQRTVREFKERFPNYGGLNARQMRDVLDGELVIVHAKGGFCLWRREDIDAGKLEEQNRKVREWNRAIRAEVRRCENEMSSRISRNGGGVDGFIKVLGEITGRENDKWKI